MEINQMKVLVVCLYAIGMVCTLFAYPTMEEARRLFPLNPPREVRANISASEKYEFCSEMHRGGTLDQKIEMEAYLISSITSRVVCATTNEPIRVVRSGKSKPHFIFTNNILLSNMELFKTNAVQMETIARYASTLKRTPPPPGFMDAPYPHSSPEVMADLQKKYITKVADPLTVAEKNRRRKILTNLEMSNRYVDELRRDLLRGLNGPIRECYEVMPTEAFTTLTNRLVELSGASQMEQEDCLFWMLGK